MRREPVPAAYRAFSRHVGLDPDVDRTPVEAVVVERLHARRAAAARAGRGRAARRRARDRRAAVGARRRPRSTGRSRCAPPGAGERLGEGDLAPDLAAGRLVVADARGPVAVLLGAVADGHGPGARTRRLRVFAVRVAGVPQIHVEEALWACTEALAA